MNENLGSDIELDDFGEPFAQANGDMGTVIGLDCFVQDQMNRIFTTRKEILHDLDAGINWESYINNDMNVSIEHQLRREIELELLVDDRAADGSVQNTEIAIDGITYSILTQPKDSAEIFEIIDTKLV